MFATPHSRNRGFVVPRYKSTLGISDDKYLAWAKCMCLRIFSILANYCRTCHRVFIFQFKKNPPNNFLTLSFSHLQIVQNSSYLWYSIHAQGLSLPPKFHLEEQTEIQLVFWARETTYGLYFLRGAGWIIVSGFYCSRFEHDLCEAQEAEKKPFSGFNDLFVINLAPLSMNGFALCNGVLNCSL